MITLGLVGLIGLAAAAMLPRSPAPAETESVA
jgi:hypothetical protein